MKQTIAHSLEFAAVFIFGYALIKVLGVNSEQSQLIVSTLIAALVKYARATDTVSDYVNN